ncbi:tRNA (adenine(58)-N(1))-methyltransferase catalytic subunit trmt61a [Kappamyces sp. JEL0829]|nr:tRNA (adenine(58)-N(1))-methyltransferase catalytic subunit trmt61a [Kappamyces sp. JEL0829]
MKAFTVQEGKDFINRHGRFPHDQMVGKKWGTKIASTSKQGFIYILHPTPEIWTLVLSHRTQILYQPDISFVSYMFGLGPGSRMIEAGIARSIAPTGRLYSFEYHQERQLTAEAEFAAHGLDSVITSLHRDVCKDGFGLEDAVTSIFLDLPSPWECIERPDFKATFMKNRLGKICCFSPCVEQVQLTCKALKLAGFVDIRMFEVLARDHDVKTTVVPSLPTTKEQKKPKRKWIGVSGQNAQNLNEGDETVLTSRIVDRVRGHTSFLTFATLFPSM